MNSQSQTADKSRLSSRIGLGSLGFNVRYSACNPVRVINLYRWNMAEAFLRTLVLKTRPYGCGAMLGDSSNAFFRCDGQCLDRKERLPTVGVLGHDSRRNIRRVFRNRAVFCSFTRNWSTRPVFEIRFLFPGNRFDYAIKHISLL